MLIDEDFKIYIELMGKLQDNVNPDKGTFKDISFDFSIELSNSKGNKVLKLNFFNCRVESIGDIQLDCSDESTEHLLPVEMTYDYYEMEPIMNYILR